MRRTRPDHSNATAPVDEKSCIVGHRWSKAPYFQRDTVLGEETLESLRVHEKTRIVNPTGWSTGKSLSKSDQQELGQPCVVDRVDHHRPARPQNPAHLLDDLVKRRDVFEDLASDHDRRRLRSDRKSRCISPHSPHSVSVSVSQCRGDQIDADVNVRRRRFEHQAATATDVHKNFVRVSRRWNE